MLLVPTLKSSDANHIRQFVMGKDWHELCAIACLEQLIRFFRAML